MPETCAAIVIAAKHGELIKVKDYSGITDTVGALRCKFEFRTDDWNNATMTAVFCKGNVAAQPSIVNNAIGVLLDGVNECAVPAEVLTRDAKYFSVGVWGVTTSGFRIVSKWLIFRIEDGCYVDATEPIEPTPGIFEQVIMALQSKASIDHKHDDIYYTKDETDIIREEALSTFVVKEAGKGLSSNDYTAAEKAKLDGIDAGANKVIISDSLGNDSTTEALSAKQGKILNDKINDINTELATKKDVFYVSGVHNIKDNTIINMSATYDEIYKAIFSDKKCVIFGLDRGGDQFIYLHLSHSAGTTIIFEGLYSVDGEVWTVFVNMNPAEAPKVVFKRGIGESGGQGIDGYSPLVDVTPIEGGHNITITDKNGTKSFDVMDGEIGPAGEKGDSGERGLDGYSPNVSIAAIEGGHRVTITDKDGEKSFNVMDGKTVTGDGGEIKTEKDILYISGLLDPIKNTVIFMETTYQEIYDALYSDNKYIVFNLVLGTNYCAIIPVSSVHNTDSEKSIIFEGVASLEEVTCRVKVEMFPDDTNKVTITEDSDTFYVWCERGLNNAFTTDKNVEAIIPAVTSGKSVILIIPTNDGQSSVFLPLSSGSNEALYFNGTFKFGDKFHYVSAEMPLEGENRITETEILPNTQTGGVSFETDETLTLKNGILSVNTTNSVEADNTLPITSAAVAVTVGNIEAILKII